MIRRVCGYVSLLLATDSVWEFAHGNHFDATYLILLSIFVVKAWQILDNHG